MLFPVELPLTKTISLSCIVSLLMMSAPYPMAAGLPAHAAASSSAMSEMPQTGQPASQQQVINVALWRVDHNFVSTMHVKNSLTTSPITVSPVLYSEEGEEYESPIDRNSRGGNYIGGSQSGFRFDASTKAHAVRKLRERRD